MSARVSVGIPVYNGERYLRAALDSIAAQTWSDLEILISDNASSDGTWAICEEFAARDPRVKLERQPANLGAARNYNRVFEMASGEYFMWAAVDDLCAPAKVERCVAVLDAQPDAVLAYPQTIVIDADGAVLGPYADHLHLPQASVVARFGRVVRRLRECNAVWGVMRASVLRSTDRIGSYPSSDIILLAQMALRGKLIEVPEPLFYRRDHAEQSVRKHPTPRSRTGWFDPARAGAVVFPMWRLWREYWRAIERAPLSPAAKVGCYLQSAWWLRLKHLEMARELGAGLAQWAGRLRAPLPKG